MKRDSAIIIEDFVAQSHFIQMNKDFDQHVIDTGPGSKKNDMHEHLKKFHGYQTTRINNLVTHSKVFREKVLNNDVFHELGEFFFREESGD